MVERVKALFFNDTLRRWHFEAIVKESEISRERVNHFLRDLLKEKFIKKIKPKRKMPYYIANRDSSRFRFEKQLYGLKLVEQSGLFEHLKAIKDVKTAILFGSFARGDWSKSSDIDLFIYGNDKDFNKGEFERKIKKEIQLFGYKNQKKLKKELEPKLIASIVQGFNIKGSLEPFKVRVNG